VNLFSIFVFQGKKYSGGLTNASYSRATVVDVFGTSLPNDLGIDGLKFQPAVNENSIFFQKNSRKFLKKSFKRSTYVDASFKFAEGDPAAIAEHLPADIFTDGGRSVQLQEHVGLQQVLGAFHFEIGDTVAETHPFVLEIVDEIVDDQPVADEVDAPQASVGVASVEGLKVVAETVFAHVLSQLAGHILKNK
jgi:hypothetical protein